MDFEQLQKAWQQQAKPEPTYAAPKSDQAQILKQVKKLRRKLFFSNFMMTVGVVANAFFFHFFWMKDFGDSAWTKVGVIVIFGALLVASIGGWLKSSPWSRQSPSLSSKKFVKSSLKSFRFIYGSLRIFVPLYMALFGIGLQLMIYGAMVESSTLHRVIAHIGLAMLMVFTGGLTIYFQRLQYQEKYEPVVQELENMLQELEQE
ncbi:hypothetical protein [Rufibacter roseus]|uniref:Uncharacterized protein n=1 Tax=Rufibacter roseus TaxID=1567108 RepID=A0ABW2DPK7_9BACT|nr:hypothetical protein [Rufibacter roseus]